MTAWHSGSGALRLAGFGVIAQSRQASWTYVTGINVRKRLLAKAGTKRHFGSTYGFTNMRSKLSRLFTAFDYRSR